MSDNLRAMAENTKNIINVLIDNLLLAVEAEGTRPSIMFGALPVNVTCEDETIPVSIRGKQVYISAQASIGGRWNGRVHFQFVGNEVNRPYGASITVSVLDEAFVGLKELFAGRDDLVKSHTTNQQDYLPVEVFLSENEVEFRFDGEEGAVLAIGTENPQFEELVKTVKGVAGIA